MIAVPLFLCLCVVTIAVSPTFLTVYTNAYNWGCAVFVFLKQNKQLVMVLLILFCSYLVKSFKHCDVLSLTT